MSKYLMTQFCCTYLYCSVVFIQGSHSIRYAIRFRKLENKEPIESTKIYHFEFYNYIQTKLSFFSSTRSSTSWFLVVQILKKLELILGLSTSAMCAGLNQIVYIQTKIWMEFTWWTDPLEAAATGLLAAQPPGSLWWWVLWRLVRGDDSIPGWFLGRRHIGTPVSWVVAEGGLIWNS